MNILSYIASALALLIALHILWRSSRFRGLSLAAYTAGAAGGLTVLASGVYAGIPNALVGLGFLLAVAATYIWIYRRARARGEGALDALTIEYEPRLSWFERGFGIVLASALLTLAWLTAGLGLPLRVGMSALAAYSLYMGISGRPPSGSVRAATPNER